MPLIDLASDTGASAHPSLSPIGGAPLDPSIPLHALGAQPGAGINLLGDFADAQSKMTAAKTASQTYNARIKAGQILAQSPDLETGMTQLFADPEVAPFAGEITSGIRQGMLAQVQAQGAQQEQATNTWDAVRKVLPALAGSPDSATWKSIVNPVLAAASPSARAAMAPALESLRGSLLDGLPDDPTSAKKMFQSRVAGLAAASPDVWGLMFGKPGSQDLGGRIQPTMTNQSTGQQTPVGSAFPKSLAPTVVHGTGPEGEDTTTVWGGGNGLGGGGSAGNGSAVARPLNGGNAPVSRPSSPANALVGPTQTASQYNNKRTDDIVDYEKSLDDRVNNGATLRKNIGATITAASQAQMGGGAEAYTKLGQALQAIGVKNGTVDKWANGSLAASQVIDKVALQNSMSQLKQQLTGVGGSRLNAQEFVAYLNKNPNLTTDPRAASEIFQLWNQFYDRDKTEQRAFDAYKQGKPTGDKTLDGLASSNGLSGGAADIKRWPALWNQSDYMAKFAPGGAIDTSAVKGTDGTPVKATHRWNPVTKQIEPVGQ